MNRYSRSWFYTTYGEAVTLHNFSASPPLINRPRFWGWAYKCMLDISMVSAEFFESKLFATYDPELTIWHRKGDILYSFVLLKRHDEEYAKQLPLYCLCVASWKNPCRQVTHSSREMTENCHKPVAMYFLEQKNDNKIQKLEQETFHQIYRGIKLQKVAPKNRYESFVFNFIYDDCEWGFSLPSNHQSVALRQLQSKWLTLFRVICKEKGVKPLSPQISFRPSVKDEI